MCSNYNFAVGYLAFSFCFLQQVGLSKAQEGPGGTTSVRLLCYVEKWLTCEELLAYDPGSWALTFKEPGSTVHPDSCTSGGLCLSSAPNQNDIDQTQHPVVCNRAGDGEMKPLNESGRFALPFVEIFSPFDSETEDPEAGRKDVVTLESTKECIAIHKCITNCRLKTGSVPPHSIADFECFEEFTAVRTETVVESYMDGDLCIADLNQPGQ